MGPTGQPEQSSWEAALCISAGWGRGRRPGICSSAWPRTFGKARLYHWALVLNVFLPGARSPRARHPPEQPHTRGASGPDRSAPPDRLRCCFPPPPGTAPSLLPPPAGLFQGLGVWVCERHKASGRWSRCSGSVLCACARQGEAAVGGGGASSFGVWAWGGQPSVAPAEQP